jgi:hypothetical protein
MTLTLTIDNATEATRIVNGFCIGSQYDPASGKTKAEWTKAKLIDYMKVTAKRGDYKTAATQISGEVDAIVIY